MILSVIGDQQDISRVRTEDGAETDLDIGHYERFLDVYLSQKANVTTGQTLSLWLSQPLTTRSLSR